MQRERLNLHKLENIKPYIECGASPRATLGALSCRQSACIFKARHFVTPDDVKRVAPKVLGHRIMLSYHSRSGAYSSR